MAEREITAEFLRTRVAYDPFSGVMTRIAATKSALIGKPIGYASAGGYLRARVGSKTYAVHRLAWLYHYGVHPSGEIDHIDGNRVNNSISNLRDVSKNVNMQNQKRAQRNNGRGVMGAYVNGNGRIFSAISVDGKRIYLGAFQSIEDAHNAYLSAKRKLHEGCTI